MASRKFPQHLATDHISQATRLLEKRREMYEKQEALDAKKEEFERKEDQLKRREESLKQKDLELQEQLIKFNVFLQENETKRTRGEKKYEDEHKLVKQKELDKTKIDAELEKFEQDKEEVADAEQKLKRYEMYLDSIVNSSDAQFSEIVEILQRQETLQGAYDDLYKKNSFAREDTDRLRSEMRGFIKTKMDEILTQNNKIADLQKQLEKKIMQSKSDELQMDVRVKRDVEKQKETAQIKMACENIYTRCLNRATQQGIKPFDAEEIDKMSADGADIGQILIKKLVVIGEEVQKYQDILKQMNEDEQKRKYEQVSSTDKARKPGSRHGRGDVADKSHGGSVRGSNRGGHTHDDGTSSTMTGS